MKYIDFNNTEVAFANKSNKELKKAHLIFKAINNPTIVRIGKAITLLAIKLHLPIRFILKPTIFDHFCGGENINDCISTVKMLSNYKIGTILDYSVEGKVTEKDFEYCANEIIANIHTAAQSTDIPFCVFKPTGIARLELLEKISNKNPLTSSEVEEYAKIKDRFQRICQNAYEANVRTFIDAEESWIQEAIDELCLLMMRQFNKHNAIIFNTIQLYRNDRLEYMHKILEIAKNEHFFLGFKLVRGAYHEKEIARAQENAYPIPVFEQKEMTDNAYDEALRFCISNINSISVCSASHNENSNQLLVELMADNNIEKENPNVFFAQLYGMSDHLSFNLAKAGYNVAKYVPYGPILEVLPYLMRRAEENTSITGQSSRELNLIKKEIDRRRE